MDMHGQKVTHRKYGAGTVIGFDGKILTVFFDQYGAHSFRYPEAFAADLKASDPDAQARIEAELKKA